MKNLLIELTSLGQSPWYDNIERRLLDSGELGLMVTNGDIRGVTSNPSIFHNAIARSNDYDKNLSQLAGKGLSTQEIYESLVINDIRQAADLFSNLYDSSRRGDGYVSLEVSPLLAHDTDRTIEEALRLWKTVDRPNLMVKIPATLEGLPAIRQAIAAGVNINVTLIFSLTRYAGVIDAYLSGLEDRLASGKKIDGIASVASFFVSRLDTKVDGRLQSILKEDPTQKDSVEPLLGKLAVANAKLAYQQFRQVFNDKRFLSIRALGGRVQRPLWASTSTKNPAYPDTLYVNNLIGPETVNTMPPQTLKAYKDHGIAEITIDKDLEQAKQALTDIESLNISMVEITNQLENEGVKAFSDSFDALLRTIEERRIHIKS